MCRREGPRKSLRRPEGHQTKFLSNAYTPSRHVAVSCWTDQTTARGTHDSEQIKDQTCCLVLSELALFFTPHAFDAVDINQLFKVQTILFFLLTKQTKQDRIIIPWELCVCIYEQ